MKESYPHPAQIEIDLVQFKKNVSLVKQYLGETKFCLPVKANAYGHGLIEMSKAAEEAGVDMLAVAHLHEGMMLRRSGIKVPILVLGAFHEDQVLDLIQYDLQFTISSRYKADLVHARHGSEKKKCLVHLELDTGMQRTGVRESSLPHLYQHVKSLSCFDVVGIYSHLAVADEKEHPFNEEQQNRFQEVMNHPLFKGEPLLWHIANSSGIVNFPNLHLQMARPALITFGYVPEHLKEKFPGIKPCFSLKSRIAYFKVVEEGEGISYGHTYHTKSETRIITIPVGYGDGFRRALSNCGSILHRGKRYPIVGAICMDQFMCDIGSNEAYVGDEVVLIGCQGAEEIQMEEIASLCDTIPYEILCQFNERIPRVYLR